jgi:hypothetical protein
VPKNTTLTALFSVNCHIYIYIILKLDIIYHICILVTKKYAMSHKTCDSYDPHIYPHSVTMNFHQLRWCLPATCPWVDFSGSLRKIEPSLRSEGWESWTVGHGPTYIFVGRKNCDLWRCLRLEPVTAIKIPSLIPYLQIFFAFNLDVMSQLGFPLSGWKVLEEQPNSSCEKRCELQTLLQL